MRYSKGGIRGASTGCAVLAALLFPVVPGPARAQMSGVGYSITPAIEHIRFADNSGIEDGFLLGGLLGFSFGEFVELDGVFLLDADTKTDFGAFPWPTLESEVLAASLPQRELRLSRYGGSAKVNLGSGPIFPFVTLGAGALSFEPEGLDRSGTVFLSAGLGLQYSFRNRYTLVFKGSNLNYRYNPAATLLSPEELAALGLDAQQLGLVTVNSLSAQVGLRLYLGGRTPGELTDLDRALQGQFSHGWRSWGLRIEPSVGTVNFSGPLGYRDDQRMVGAAVGVDLGSFAGVRSFYWRATEDGEWGNLDDLEAFGGEMQFTFERSLGLTPFVSVGAGYVNVRSGYVGNGEAEPQDRPFAMGGVGLLLPLTSSVSFVGNVRSLLMSSTGRDAVTDPGRVRANTMFSAALSIGLGGGGGEAPHATIGREMEATRSEQEQLRRDLETTRAELDSLASLVGGGPGGPGAAGGEVDTTTGAVRGTSSAGAGRRWMTVPVPEEGEIYLRYGKPGGVSVETVTGEDVGLYYDPTTGMLTPVPSAVREAAAARDTAGSTSRAPGGAAGPTASADIPGMIQQALTEEREAARIENAAATDSLYRRLERLLERRYREMDQELEDLRAQVQSEPQAPGPVERQPSAGPSSPSSTPPPPAAEPLEPSAPGDLEAIRFVTGLNLNEPHQGLLGGRIEYRPGGRSFLLGPELLLGFGDGDRTTTFNLDVVKRFEVRRFGRIVPLAGMGAGIQHRGETKGVFNLLAGAEYPVRGGWLSLEYVSQNLFDNNRLKLGYRLQPGAR